MVIRRDLVIICFVICLATALIIADTTLLNADASEAHEQLQGDWKILECVRGGEVLSNESTANLIITFTANRITGSDKQAGFQANFSLNPFNSPKGIDITPLDGPHKNKTLMGIYEIKGDIAKICLTEKDLGNRPQVFVSMKGSDAVLLVIKRMRK